MTYPFSVEFSKMKKRASNTMIDVYWFSRFSISIRINYLMSNFCWFLGGKFHEDSPRKTWISNPSSIQNIDSKPITHSHSLGRVKACETGTTKAWSNGGNRPWRWLVKSLVNVGHLHQPRVLERWIAKNNLPSLKLTAKAPENGWLEDDPFLLGWSIFQVRTVSFRECKCWCHNFG